MRPERTAAALILALAAMLALAGCGGSDSGTTTSTAKARNAVRLGPAFGSMAALPGILQTTPPWPANDDEGKLQLRLRAIGLDPLTAEGQALHIHQHLDIFVEGRKATIPAQVGIGAAGSFISDLHTHDNSGILHVESPTVRAFSLGQFFAVWGVRLDARCIGGLCVSGAKSLRAWVNGKPVAADPTRIALAEHQEIVLAFGAAAQVPKTIPATYDFAGAGL